MVITCSLSKSGTTGISRQSPMDGTWPSAITIIMQHIHRFINNFILARRDRMENETFMITR